MKKNIALVTGSSAFMHLVAAKHPWESLQLLSFPGEDPMKRMYRTGYEKYFEQMPVLNPGDTEDIPAKMDMTRKAMQLLATALVDAPSNWVTEHPVPIGEFHRHIIALEEPKTASAFGDMAGTAGEQSLYVPQGGEGKELVVAHWGEGFTSPVHGHAPGLIMEQLLSGNLVVNRYRLVDPANGVVRMTSSTLYSGTREIEFAFTQEDENAFFPRQNLIHNFVSYGTSHSLHYVPEHVRNGRDNQFKVEYFEDVYGLDMVNTRALTREGAKKLQPGNVLLVRSANVPGLRDHFCVITGDLTVKAGGVICQKDLPIMAKNGGHVLLDEYAALVDDKDKDTILLQLSIEAAEQFLAFHDIQIEASTKEFDDVYDLRYDEVKPITTQEAISLRKGDVVLVRSTSLPEKGDHYILVTGHAIEKPHGFRPQTAVFPAMQESPLLDLFDEKNSHVVLLKLNQEAKAAFHAHYGIHENEAHEIVSDNHQLVMG